MTKLESYVRMLQDLARFVEFSENKELDYDVEATKEDFDSLMTKINRELDKKLDKKVAE